MPDSVPDSHPAEVAPMGSSNPRRGSRFQPSTDRITLRRDEIFLAAHEKCCLVTSPDDL
jgi:hypothetical protein